MALPGGDLMLINQNTYAGPTTVSGGGVLQLNSSQRSGIDQQSDGFRRHGRSGCKIVRSTARPTSRFRPGLANIGAHNNTVNNLQTTGGTIAGTAECSPATTPLTHGAARSTPFSAAARA